MLEETQGVIIVNNEILILKRADIKKLAPGRWNFIGGSVEEYLDLNEAYALQRKILEEINVNIHVIKKGIIVSKKLMTWGKEKEPFLCYTFFIYLNEKPEIKLNHEHSEFKWININDFNKYNIIGFSREEINEEVIKSFNKV